MNKITHWNITTTPEEEIFSRRTRLFKELEKYNVEGIVFYNAKAIRYFANCICCPSERPIALVLRMDGYAAMMVPRMEYEHTQSTVTAVDKIIYYKEYPGNPNPMYMLSDLLGTLGMGKGKIASDYTGYPAVEGSRCPALSDVNPNLDLVILPYILEDLQIIKSEFDLKCIRESCRWGNLAMTFLQENTHIGLREIEVQEKTGNMASEIMLKTLGPHFPPSTLGYNSLACAAATYRGQISSSASNPHVNAKNLQFHEGDSMIGESWAYLLEYGSELERVFFVGEPGKEQLKYYKLAVEAQNTAISIIREGVTCSEVDKEMKRFFKENNLEEYWRHHTGHSLGFNGHEHPFIDENEPTVLKKGMVFSVEPGIYINGVGGFRLSDTVVVTEDGVEMLTYFPREIEHLICW